MTLKEIKNLEKDYLTCNEVAEVLRCNKQSLHHQAENNPEKLGFPVIQIGTRIKFPRLPFIRFMEGESR